MAKIVNSAGETLEIDREMGPVKVLQRGASTALAGRKIKCVVSTPSVDRAGDIIEVEGIDLANYKANPVVLLQHDPNRPIARCTEIRLEGSKLVAEATFPEPGISADADRVYGLIQAGILGAVSIGAMPKEWAFINDKRPWDGTKYIRSEMLEFSIVALPMNAEALIVGRAGDLAEAKAQREALMALMKASEVETPEEDEGENEESEKEEDKTASTSDQSGTLEAAATDAGMEPEGTCLPPADHGTTAEKAARLRAVQVLRAKALI